METQKKKKTIIYLVSGILIVAGIGGATYLAWPKNKPTESQEPTNFQQEIQQLQSQLNVVKSQLANFSDNTKKTQLENKLTTVEKKIKNPSNLDQPSLKELEREIEEIKEEIKKNDFPNPQPNNKGWNYSSAKINDNTYKYQITCDNRKIDFDDFIDLLQKKDRDFFQIFQGVLKDANSKFPAFFWECPPVAKNNLRKTFQFVITKSQSLADKTENSSSFKKYLAENNDNRKPAFVAFPNNQQPSDAILVIPSYIDRYDQKHHDFKNISTFTQNASEKQQQDFWQGVATELEKQLKKDDAPRWLSTHGMGVSYLHVRIDEKPKYYSHTEYKKFE